MVVGAVAGRVQQAVFDPRRHHGGKETEDEGEQAVKGRFRTRVTEPLPETEVQNDDADESEEKHGIVHV